MRRRQNETRYGHPDLPSDAGGVVYWRSGVHRRWVLVEEHMDIIPTVEDCEDMLIRKKRRAVINDGKVVRFIGDDEEE